MERLAVLLGLLVAGASESRAHPLHTSMAHIEVTTAGVLSVRVRVFSDDFSAAVARATGAPVGPNFTVSDNAARSYFSSRLVLRVHGRAARLALQRQARDADVTWLEFTVPGVRSLENAELENRILMEFHVDQVNVVRAKTVGRERTVLFSQGSTAQRL